MIGSSGDRLRAARSAADETIQTTITLSAHEAVAVRRQMISVTVAMSDAIRRTRVTSRMSDDRSATMTTIAKAAVMAPTSAIMTVTGTTTGAREGAAEARAVGRVTRSVSPIHGRVEPVRTEKFHAVMSTSTSVVAGAEAKREPACGSRAPDINF